MSRSSYGAYRVGFAKAGAHHRVGIAQCARLGTACVTPACRVRCSPSCAGPSLRASARALAARRRASSSTRRRCSCGLRAALLPARLRAARRRGPPASEARSHKSVSCTQSRYVVIRKCALLLLGVFPQRLNVCMPAAFLLGPSLLSCWAQVARRCTRESLCSAAEVRLQCGPRRADARCGCSTASAAAVWPVWLHLWSPVVASAVQRRTAVSDPLSVAGASAGRSGSSPSTMALQARVTKRLLCLPWPLITHTQPLGLNLRFVAKLTCCCELLKVG